MTTYTYPANNELRARGTSLVSGFVLADWYEPEIWVLSGTYLQNYIVPEQRGGFAGAVLDGSSNLWAIGLTGPLYMLSLTGVPLYEYLTPPNTTFTGIAAYGANVYAVTSTGALYINTSSTVSGLNLPAYLPAYMSSLTANTLSATFGQLSRGLFADASYLYTLLPDSQSIGLYDLSTNVVSTLTGTPATSSCFAFISNGNYGVCGWQPEVISYDFNDMAFSDATTNLIIAVNNAAGLLYVLSPNYRTWAVATTIALASPNYATWTPNIAQVLATSTANGTVSVYTLDINTLTLSQTITGITNAGQIYVGTSELYAYALQTASNEISVLSVNVSTWSLMSTVAVTNPTCLLVTGETTNLVGFTNGYATFDYIDPNWVLGTTVTLPYTPSQFLIKSDGDIYICGSSATNGYLSIILSGQTIETITWTGNATGMIERQGQVCVVDVTSNLIRVFEDVSGVFSQANTLAISGQSFIMDSVETIFAYGPTVATLPFEFSLPYTLSPVETGVASIYTASAWTTTILGVGERPGACVFDSSSNLWVATDGNNLYEVSTTGIVSQSVMQQTSNQDQSVPIGVSALMWDGTTLYGTACLQGGLINLITT